MKIALDSYCFHRFFGDWYPGIQQDPGTRMTWLDFLDEAARLGVAGVSLEACYLRDLGPADLDSIRAALRARGLEVVWAWGHPDGLQSGHDRQAFADLLRHIDIAHRVGARVMRICAGSRRTRPATWAQHRDTLLPMLRQIALAAKQHQIVIAIENHIDLLADELLELVTTIDSPWLGVCLDTANNLRLLEDPVEVAQKLAPYVKTTHIKDIAAYRGHPTAFSFWPSVPLGMGAVDIARILDILKQADYQGMLALEIDYLHPAMGDERAAIAQSIGYLRDALTLESAAAG